MLGRGEPLEPDRVRIGQSRTTYFLDVSLEPRCHFWASAASCRASAAASFWAAASALRALPAAFLLLSPFLGAPILGVVPGNPGAICRLSLSGSVSDGRVCVGRGNVDVPGVVSR